MSFWSGFHNFHSALMWMSSGSSCVISLMNFLRSAGRLKSQPFSMLNLTPTQPGNLFTSSVKRPLLSLHVGGETSISVVPAVGSAGVAVTGLVIVASTIMRLLKARAAFVIGFNLGSIFRGSLLVVLTWSVSSGFIHSHCS